MRDGEYVLGIDFGDDTVAAAVCRREGTLWGPAEALWLEDRRPLGRASVDLAPEGPVRLADRRDVPGAHTASHVMSRVGIGTPLYLGGRAVDAGAVAAAVVTRVLELAEAQEGAPPARTVLAVPPSWGPHRRSMLLEFLAPACPDVALVSAAVAVAYHHVATEEVPGSAVVAVYDLGASTLDTAVVGPAEDGALRHVGVPPAPLAWGGRDVDDALLGHLLRCLEQADDATSPATPPAARTAVDGLRERAVAAKEALAVDTVVCVDLPMPTGPVRVTREELDELVAERLGESVAQLAAALAAAGVAAEDLDAVVLAGGAARLPLVAERLSAALDVAVVVDPAPELSVALGAAHLAAVGRPEAVASPSGGAVPSAAAPPDDSASPPGRHPTSRLPVTGGGRPPQRGRAGAARPERSPAGPGPSGPRLPARPGDRRFSRSLVVAAMFLGMVGLTSSMVSVITDVRTAPVAQGQAATAPGSAVPDPSAPAEDPAVPPDEEAGPAPVVEARAPQQAETRTRSAGKGSASGATAATTANGTTSAASSTAVPEVTGGSAPTPTGTTQPTSEDPSSPPTTPPTTPPPTSEPPDPTTPGPVSTPTAEPLPTETPGGQSEGTAGGTGTAPGDVADPDGTVP